MKIENKNEYEADVDLKSCHYRGKSLPLQMYYIM